MKKVLFSKIAQLRNDEHIQLMEGIALHKETLESMGFGKTSNKFLALLEEEIKARKVEARLEFSPDVQKWEKKRNNSLRALVQQAKSDCIYDDQPEGEAARTVLKIVGKIEEVISRNIEAKTSHIDAIIAQIDDIERQRSVMISSKLLPKLSPELKKKRTLLEARNVEFQKAKLARHAERSGKPSRNVGEVRTKIDETLRHLLEEIRVSARNSDFDKEHTELIAYLNTVFQKFDVLLKSRETRRTNAKAAKSAVAA